MVVTGLFRAGMVLLTGMLMLTGILTVSMLLIATFLISVSESCADPAYMAAIPQITPKEKMDAGLALRSMVAQTAMFVGSGIGGICIGLFGGGGALLLDGVMFAIGSFALITLRLKNYADETHEEAQKENYLQTLKAGFRYFKQHSSLMFLCLLSVCFNIFLSSKNQIQTAFVVEILNLEAYALSTIGVANPVDMFVGAMLYPLVKKRLLMRKLLLLCGMTVAADYLFFVLLGFVNGMAWLKYIAIFIMGFAMPMAVSLSSLTCNALFFRVVEEGYLSRMASIFNSIGRAAVPVASVYSGALVSVMPIQWVYIASAVLLLVSTLVVIRLKNIRELESLANPQEVNIDEVAL